MAENQAWIGYEHVGAGTPLAGVVEGWVGGTDSVWLLHQGGADAELDLESESVG